MLSFTLFVNRGDVESLLPPELTIVDDDQLPDWLRQRDGHPLIAIIGTSKIGARKRILGEHRTIPLFPSFLETFIAVPYLRAVDGGAPSPCFHFPRVFCETFWPTELGVLCVGWPKRQCPMRLNDDGERRRYEIDDDRTGKPVLSATIELSDQKSVSLHQSAMSRVAEMFSLPLVLIKNKRLRTIRLESAT